MLLFSRPSPVSQAAGETRCSPSVYTYIREQHQYKLLRIYEPAAADDDMIRVVYVI